MTIALMLVLWIGTVVAKPAAAAEPVAEEAKEINVPPGFSNKKRGKYVLYCKRDTPMGTRLNTETCYDETGLRDYLLALAENKRDVDRIRATCTTACACGQPEAC